MIKLLNFTVRPITAFLLFVFLASEVNAQLPNYVFEILGEPIRSALPIEFVTKDEEKGAIAWAGLTDAERNMLIGINIDNGDLIEVDLTRFGKSNAVLLFKGSERYIYVYAGKRGRFFKYDIHLNKLVCLGGESKALYWMKTSYAIAPDGKVYVGTYPNAEVTVLNPHTDEVKVLERVSSSAGTEYVINPTSSADGIVYFPTGMQHGELWAFNPETNIKKQILPDSLMTYGPPVVWTAVDGKVYGKKGEVKFLCAPKGVIIGKTAAKMPNKKSTEIDGKTALFIDRDGYLVMEDLSGRRSKLKSDFKASAHEVFSIGDVHAGKLFGSGMKPGHVFTYDTASGSLLDLGKITRGGIQVYDILSYRDRLFMSSYTGGFIDCFDMGADNTLGRRQSVAHLHPQANQERVVQLVVGKDGMIYAPTAPIKGYLGGTIIQINPENLETKVFDDLIHNQSYTSITSIPSTGELFVTSSIKGGTSAKPTEKEAFIFLWDPKTARITYKGCPVSGSPEYGKAVMAHTGLIYGVASDRLYIFDPINKKVVLEKEMESGNEGPAKLILSERLGRNGLVYGVDSRNGRLFSLNPANNQVSILATDATLTNTRFAEIKDDGYLYYANHSKLMRVRLID